MGFLVPTRAGGRTGFSGLLAAMSRGYHEVSFASAGRAEEVLEYRRRSSRTTGEDGDGDDDRRPPPLAAAAAPLARVEMLAAPWNPADVLAARGAYPSPYPSEPDAGIGSAPTGGGEEELAERFRRSRHFDGRTVAGSEGWGRVTDVVSPRDRPAGEADDDDDDDPCPPHLQPGDFVAVGKPGLGTLRSSAWLPVDALIRLDGGRQLRDGNDPAASSSLFQLGGTALRMLRDYATLGPGDVVLQNAGNSAVGFVLSQLAAAAAEGVRVVSIVRRGSKTPEEFASLKEWLTTTGKNRMVLAQEDLLRGDDDYWTSVRSELRSLGRPPVLALNAVGGDSARLLLRMLSPGGTLVTYGAMGSQPDVLVTAPELIFKDVTLRGHWHSRWMVRHSYQERSEMMNELVDYVLQGKLRCPPTKVFRLSQLQEALKYQTAQSNAVIREKIVFSCQE
jgi:trans-2-enoyl-CoA reductase